MFPDKEGRAEALMNTAKNLLKLGISVAVIQSATSLSKEQVPSLMTCSEKN